LFPKHRGIKIIDLIKKRRSIRKFTTKVVSDETIKQIVDAGQWAPSSCNQQMWNFLIIRDDGAKKTLVEKCGTSALALNAPVIIIVTYNNKNIKEGLESASAAIQNMLLAATSLGVGSLWMDSLGDPVKIKKMFNIPNEDMIVSFVLLGYSQKVPPPPKRKPVESILHFDSFKATSKSKFFHDPDKWSLKEIQNYQKFFCRKTDMGTKMDIVNIKEADLIANFVNEAGSVLDLFSYDGSLLRLFSTDTLHTLDLTEESSDYTKHAMDSITQSVYDSKINLATDSMDLVSCLFKLERIPKNEHSNLIKEIKRVMKSQASFVLVFREKRSLYGLIYKLIQIVFEDDIRKTGIFSFFGPYKPLKTKYVINLLKRHGFKVKTRKYFLIPPIIEDLYQLFLQYKISGKSSFLHRVKRTTFISKILALIIRKQKQSFFGSDIVLVAKK